MSKTNERGKKTFLRLSAVLMMVAILAVPGFHGSMYAAENEGSSSEKAADTGGTNQTTTGTAGQTAPANAADPAAAGNGAAEAPANAAQNAAAPAAKSEPVKKPSLSAKKLKIVSANKKKLTLRDCRETPVWKSSNTKVAVIKKTSNRCQVWIKGKKAGKATITAKVGSQKYRCKVTVKYKPKLSVTKKTLKGKTSVSISVSGTVDKAVWSSSDPDIAVVSKTKGKTVKVSSVRNGKATIYATVNGKTLSCAIRVKGLKPTVNCIMGSAREGYYYVDSTGSRVYDDQIVAALNFLNSVSSPSQSPRDRMRACFRELCTYTYSWHPDSPSASVMPRYAADTFRTKIANCWRFGAAFAYIAKVLGYESRVCIGGVTAYQNHALDNHGWCEIYIDGTWKMVDVSMQMHHPEVSLFLVPRDAYPFRLRCDSIYTLRVSNGYVYWG